MKLWLIRHARPLIEAGVCYGATDMAADSQATEVSAQALAQVLPLGLRVVSSPLKRCVQLVQALKTLRPDLNATPDARLVEMDFGCWEGVRWDAIPKDAHTQWVDNFSTYRFGGRESVGEFMQRVAWARADLTSQTEEAVWITHAGVIRAMTLLSQGLSVIDRADQWPKNTPEWGQWWEVQI